MLAQGENITVAQCTSCKVLNIWRSGVLMNFSFSQFDVLPQHPETGIRRLLENRPDGKEVVILSTPFPDISLAFTREEWQNFFKILNEANDRKRVYELVHG